MTTAKPALVYASCSALALLALIGTWGHNVAYLTLGFVGANRQFWLDTLVNPASRSITFDIFALALPVFYWMLSEARRLSMRGAWGYIAASLFVAISVAVPVFVMHRHYVLTRGAQPAAAEAGLTRGDWLGLTALLALTLGYFYLSFAAPIGP